MVEQAGGFDALRHMSNLANMNGPAANVAVVGSQPPQEIHGPNNQYDAAASGLGNNVAAFLALFENLVPFLKFGKTKSLLESAGKNSYGWTGSGQPKQTRALGIFTDTHTSVSGMLSQHVHKGSPSEEYSKNWDLHLEMRGPALVDAVAHIQGAQISHATEISGPPITPGSGGQGFSLTA